MKKIIVNIALVFSIVVTMAQAPQMFSYQAVVRDASNNLVQNQSVGMQVSILEGSETGTAVYVETHSPTTNVNGLVSINIGDGSTSDDFSSISWATNTYFVKTEIDLTGGSTYTISSTSQLLSAPYALHANTVNNTDDADADPTNELQSLSKSTDSIFISDGNGILMPNGLNLWKSNGTDVYLPSGNVGLGTGVPTGKLEVKGNATDTPDDLLFSVVNNNGDTVFAVYQGAVEIRVDSESTLKQRRKGGFAVASSNTGSKSSMKNLLVVNEDSIRMYIDDGNAKQRRKGGFAVASSNTGSKSINNNLLEVTKDSTRIYVDDADAGFAVNNTESGTNKSLMSLTKENYFIGHESGVGVTPSGDSIGKFNAFLGYQTGTSVSTGYRNILLGYRAGQNLTSGFDNTFIGYKTGSNADTAKQNVYIGTNVGIAAAGQKNIMIGDSAGYSDNQGNDNIFMGHASGFSNQTGHHNVFLGPYTGNQNTTGSYNVFLGHQSGYHSSSGTDNVFIGDKAGHVSATGSHNIYIGGQTGMNNTGHNNVFIGFKAGFFETGKNDRLIIENTHVDSSQALVYGDFAANMIRFNNKVGVGMHPGLHELEVHGSAFKDDGSTAWLTTSDRRIKTNVKDIDNAMATIKQLRPVKFDYTEEWKATYPNLNKGSYYSFIAQEFQEVFPEAVSGTGQYLEDDSDEILSIDVHNAQIVTVKAVQELIEENEELKAEVSTLKSQFEMLKAEIDALKNK